MVRPLLTRTRSLRIITLAGTALVALLLPPADGAVHASSSTASVFTAARASRSAGGYEVTWRSTGGPVTVYANHDPAATKPGTVVGHGSANASIKVASGTLASGQRWYFHLTNGKRSVAVAPQSLGLAHDPNLRDIGGIRTEDGRWIKEGLLFRGGAMDKLTDAEVARLAALGVTKSIDLRTPDEVAQAPDKLPAGVPTISDSILANDDASVTWNIGGLDTADVFRLMGYARGQYMFIYDELGGGPAETYGFRRLFDEVLASDGAPVLYHCTAGDDRTGWATYVLLRVLGVSPQAAMRNYLASNRYNVDMLQGYTDYFESIGFTHEQSDFFLRADYIEAAEHTALTTFGSWSNYLRLGLGLTSADVAKLKSLYLSK
ncbi:tyrosine-protein phosphatase [Nocardioides ultimimeridianus]